MGYRTAKREALAEFTERKSRFLGYIRPVQTEEQALAFVNQVRAEHREATHNVYAYILQENNIMRFSDDGEPQGTAGRPVLGVLQNEGLIDVAVVVTRYFGGVLLGAGGLVRAYARAAKEAVDAAGIAEMQPHLKLRLTVEYGLYETLLRKLPAFCATLEDATFESEVTLEICIPSENSEKFGKWLREVSGGKVSSETVGKLDKPLNCI